MQTIPVDIMAVKRRVAASTQNQASNPLLFLYRHILKKDFDEHKDIPRAMKSKCCESEV